MCRFRNRLTVGMIVSLLTVCTGCQLPRDLSFPWSKPAPNRWHQAAAPAELPPALTEKQKIDLQIALAVAAERQGRLEEAKKTYQGLIKTAPQRTELYHRLALLHSRQGECNLAESYYLQGLTLDPAHAELHCDLGYNYYLQERWTEAEASLRRAIALDNDLARAHNNLGLLLARTGRESEAMHQFAMAGAMPAEASVNLALAMIMDGRVEQAEAAYRYALRVNPSLQTAREGLATLQSFSAHQVASHAAPIHRSAPRPYGGPYDNSGFHR
jgi:Tfp pilus assembly protein PilF